MEFSDRARMALQLAKQEAARWPGIERIGTAHLLIGLMKEDGNGAAILKSLGLDMRAVREAFEKATDSPEPPMPPFVVIPESMVRVVHFPKTALRFQRPLPRGANGGAAEPPTDQSPDQVQPNPQSNTSGYGQGPEVSGIQEQ